MASGTCKCCDFWEAEVVRQRAELHRKLYEVLCGRNLAAEHYGLSVDHAEEMAWPTHPAPSVAQTCRANRA